MVFTLAYLIRLPTESIIAQILLRVLLGTGGSLVNPRQLLTNSPLSLVTGFV